jgi:DNA-binding transcriptional LysR family regulator
MRYTLRQLEVFLAVAREQSVSRAGQRLAMSQSAVSGALSDLERQFDVQLFDRVGKRLQLSELGRSLRAEAEALEDRALELERTLSRKGDVGALRVGATLTIGNHVAVPLMARFMREHPGARVSLVIANTAEIARKLKNFELDVGLVEGELSEPDLQVTPWRKDELVVFCAKQHPLAKRRALSDRELKAASWIVRETGSGTRQTFERAMTGILPQLSISLELGHTEAIKSAVLAGLGVGCVSKIAVHDELRRGDLVHCKVPHRNFRRHFYFVLHAHKFHSASVAKWLELCR